MRAMRNLAIFLGLWLLFNLVAMPLWWGGISASGGFRGAVQLAVLVGFALIILFDLISAGFILNRICWVRERDPGEGCQKGWLLVLAVMAMVGMMGAKVMVDEIGRETSLGMAAAGEWVILYICLGLQLSYLLAIPFQEPRAPHHPAART